MAQTPEINQTFLREVDDNLRRDRLRDFARKNGKWLIVALVLFLVASGGFIWWQQHRQQQSEQQVEQLVDAYRTLGTGKSAEATKQLVPLADSGSKAIRASAIFASAVTAIERGDTKTAIAKFSTVAADNSLPQPYRDLALIRQTALEFDQIKPDQVVSRLEPLAKPDSPWFGTAGEMTALAFIKQGKKGEAGQLFAAIAKDKKVPDSTRERAIQIASSLGVDASSALPQPQ
ncbi:MAG: tetratricopeptide repeat protein [Sphingomicrobium sp.]